MDDSDILKMSFGAAAVGLALLFLVSSYSTAPVVKINELSFDNTGTKVAVKGDVTSLRLHEDGHIFLKLSDDTGEISIAIFKNVAEKLDSQKKGCVTRIGMTVEIAGAVEEYRDELEIIPQSTGDVECPV
jgi:DNA/RNA endonuclease YhcR with UshA esterase domain